MRILQPWLHPVRQPRGKSPPEPNSSTTSHTSQSHKNRHTGLRPYKCSQCPKTFPQPSNVRSHEKTHVARDKRASWVCKFGKCTKTFTEKGNLKVNPPSYTPHFPTNL